jgi:hypothetical protein
MARCGAEAVLGRQPSHLRDRAPGNVPQMLVHSRLAGTPALPFARVPARRGNGENRVHAG